MKRLSIVLMLLMASLMVFGGCAEPTPTPTPPTATPVEQEASGEVPLGVTNQVENELAFSMSNLRSMEVVEITVKHPKEEGEVTYTGVRLNDILDKAGVSDDAELTFTASDAYTAVVPVSDARACKDCLVAFQNGSLRMVMPDMGSSFWVKDVISIEAK